MKVPLKPIWVDFETIAGIPCPCGTAQRGLIAENNGLCSLHVTEISSNAKIHYHKSHTEVYFFLEGEGKLELDAKVQPVKPGMAILIPPGVRHRAIVEKERSMKIINFVLPPFDPDDEWFD